MCDFGRHPRVGVSGGNPLAAGFIMVAVIAAVTCEKDI
jgi:hypothetical protein